MWRVFGKLPEIFLMDLFSNCDKQIRRTTNNNVKVDKMCENRIRIRLQHICVETGAIFFFECSMIRIDWKLTGNCSKTSQAQLNVATSAMKLTLFFFHSKSINMSILIWFSAKILQKSFILLETVFRLHVTKSIA